MRGGGEGGKGGIWRHTEWRSVIFHPAPDGNWGKERKEEEEATFQKQCLHGPGKEREKEHPLFASPTFSILSDAHGRALFTCAQEKRK